jgi:hypothetical protein
MMIGRYFDMGSENGMGIDMVAGMVDWGQGIKR